MHASNAQHTLLYLLKTKINCEFIENGVSEDKLKKLQNDSNDMNVTSNPMKMVFLDIFFMCFKCD